MNAKEDLKGWKLIGVVNAGDFGVDDNIDVDSNESHYRSIIDKNLSKYLNGYNPYNYNEEDFLTDAVFDVVYGQDENAMIFMDYDGDRKIWKVLSENEIDDSCDLEIGLTI